MAFGIAVGHKAEKRRRILAELPLASVEINRAAVDSAWRARFESAYFKTQLPERIAQA
jgi:hypothetical protein